MLHPYILHLHTNLTDLLLIFLRLIIGLNVKKKEELKDEKNLVQEEGFRSKRLYGPVLQSKNKILKKEDGN